MNGDRWWEFGVFDVAWCVGCLLVIYWLFGPPTTVVGWLGIAPGLLIGSFIGHLIRKRLNRG